MEEEDQGRVFKPVKEAFLEILAFKYPDSEIEEKNGADVMFVSCRQLQIRSFWVLLACFWVITSGSIK